MSRYFSIENESLLLFGDTYIVRERIKQSGGRWDSKIRMWRLAQTPQSLQLLDDLGFSQQTPTHVAQTGIDEDITKQKNLEEAKDSLTVAQVSQLVQQVMSMHFSQPLWVVGEISGLKRSGRHIYFDLADVESKEISEPGRMHRTTSLNCALWGDQIERIASQLKDFNLSDGLMVRVRCSVDYRKDSGRIVLHIEDFDKAFSEGNIALNRQKIVAELKKRQLYDRNKRIQPHFFGFRIALVTSNGSRALTDFIDELNRSRLPFKVTLLDVHMQGMQTSSDVSKAFQTIATREKEFDYVVLTRGGGSRLDLRWFDDLEICKQIAHCTLPVVSAIGHFEDVSVADEVSFAAEKTPTGAARYLIETIRANQSLLTESYTSIGRLAHRRLNREQHELSSHKTRIGLLVRNILKHEKTKLIQTLTTLKIVRSSIDKIASKGFGLVRTEDGAAIHPRDIDPAKHVQLLLDFKYKENDIFIKKRLVIKPVTIQVTEERE